MRGSPARIIPLFAWVVIDMVLWGFITRYLNEVTSPRFDFVTTLLGAVLLWDFLTRILHGVTTAFFEDVWSRNFLNFFATPLTVGEYIAGLVITSILTGSVGLVAMLLLATLIFGLSFAIYGLMLFPYMIILLVFGISLGIYAISLVLRFGPATEWFIWPLPALIAPFVGVFYPLSTLPDWMRYIGYLLPPSYVFEGMRATVLQSAFSEITLLAGACLAVLNLLLSYVLFVRIYRRALNSGLLARYSAENVS